MSQDKILSHLNHVYLPSETPNIEISYEQEPLSNYLDPSNNDVFDTRRFTPSHHKESEKTATPKERRSRSPATGIKSGSGRPSSARLINKCLYKIIGEIPKCHGRLSKRVENLEKKQDLWRERSQVWEKERKSYQIAIENVIKNPSDFYKEQLRTWNDSRTIKQINEKSLKDIPKTTDNLIEWIRAQPDECSIQEVKNFINEKFTFGDTFENSTLQENVDNKNTDTYLKDLSEKNEELSHALSNIEKELRSKVEVLEILKEKLEKMQMLLNEKDNALLEEKTINDAMLMRINELKVTENSKMPRQIIEIKNQLESKEIEIVMLKSENSQLKSNLEQVKASNSIYLSTIDELRKKLQLLRLDSGNGIENIYFEKSFTEEELSSLENIDSFSDINIASVSTQTPIEFFEQNHMPQDKKKNSSYISYISCMANAIEEIIFMQNK